jgi:hypothetical protein
MIFKYSAEPHPQEVERMVKRSRDKAYVDSCSATGTMYLYSSTVPTSIYVYRSRGKVLCKQ